MVGDWPSSMLDASAGTDAQNRGDAQIGVDCPAPWLIAALRSPARVVRFSLAPDRPALRCPDLTGGGELDPTLLDAEAVSDDLIIVAGHDFVQGLNVASDTVAWTRAPGTPLDESIDDAYVFAIRDVQPWAGVGWKRQSPLDGFSAYSFSRIDLFAADDGEVLDGMGLLLSMLIRGVATDPETEGAILMTNGNHVYRYEPFAGVQLADLIIAAEPPNEALLFLEMHTTTGRGLPRIATLDSRSGRTFAQITLGSDPLGTLYVGPPTCQRALEVAPDPASIDHVFLQCPSPSERTSLLRYDLTSGGIELLLGHAGSEPNADIRGIGVFAGE